MFRKRKLWIIAASAILLAIAGAFCFLPVFGTTQRFTELDHNLMRLKSITTAIRDYQVDTNKPFPESLRALVPDYLDPKQFADSLYKDGVSKRTYDWLYFGGLHPTTPDSAIIAASPSIQLCSEGMMHHRIVAYADARVETITDEDFQQRLKAQRNEVHK